MTKLGVALIGSGIFARDAHLPSILKSSNLELKALYSRTFKSACALAAAQNLSTSVKIFSEVLENDPKSTSDNGYAALLKENDIDAVIIALPIPSQPAYIQQALDAGKHVLSEKPIGPDVATARKVLESFQSNDTSATWSVAENWRLLPAYNYAATQVAGLGPLLGFRARQSLLMEDDNPFLQTAWRKSPKHQGGLLLDGAVHGIASIRTILGAGFDVKRVCAFTNQLQAHLPSPDTLDAIVRATNGITGTFGVSFGSTFPGPVFEIACQDGVVTVSGFSTVTVEKNTGEKFTETFPGLEQSVDDELKLWVEGIQSGRQDIRLSPQEGLVDLQILESMLESGSLDGRPIDIEI